MITRTKYLILLCLSFGLIASASGQDLRYSLSPEDSANIEALVLYPEDIRESIFEASQHPATLVQISELRNYTSQSMIDLVSELPQDEQEEIWNLSRFPDLFKSLGGEKAKSKKEIQLLLEDYPQEIHEVAQKHGKKHHELLLELSVLYDSSNANFEATISDLDPSVQNSFRKLLNEPEVLQILTENLRLTILAGESFRNNPEGVRRYADSLHLEVARQYAQQLDDWKQELESNPEGREEFQQAAEEFAEDSGYESEQYTREVEHVTVVNYVSRPYPFWFGYPYWYEYPRWHYYPWWYDWGFYYGTGGTIVVFSFPSSYYLNWYFGRPWHHYYYPHFTNSCVSYYYGHRTSRTHFVAHVREWKQENNDVITDKFLADDGNRVERIKEYGRLEKDVQNYNIANARQPVTREKYLEDHKKEYPTVPLNPQREEQKVPREKTPVQKPQTPEYKPKTPVKPRIFEPDRQVPKTPDRSKDYHKIQWERTKPPAKPSRPVIKPDMKKPPPAPKKAPSKKRR